MYDMALVYYFCTAINIIFTTVAIIIGVILHIHIYVYLLNLVNLLKLLITIKYNYLFKMHRYCFDNNCTYMYIHMWGLGAINGNCTLSSYIF